MRAWRNQVGASRKAGRSRPFSAEEYLYRPPEQMPRRLCCESATNLPLTIRNCCKSKVSLSREYQTGSHLFDLPDVTSIGGHHGLARMAAERLAELIEVLHRTVGAELARRVRIGFGGYPLSSIGNI